MVVDLEYLDPAGLEASEEQVIAVYRAAFILPPYSIQEYQVASFAQSLLRHASRRSYRCVVARDRATGCVVGFTYGYAGEPGQWWRDVVASAMSRSAQAHWLADYFELAELAVDPAAQGQGIGGRLHDMLLDGLPHRTAALSTRAVETAAMHLYRKRGWVPLLQDFVFPGGIDPYLIMGLELHQDGQGC